MTITALGHGQDGPELAPLVIAENRGRVAHGLDRGRDPGRLGLGAALGRVGGLVPAGTASTTSALDGRERHRTDLLRPKVADLHPMPTGRCLTGSRTRVGGIEQVFSVYQTCACYATASR